MAGEGFHAFDESSAKKIASAVTRLKYQQENLHKQIRNLQSRADQNAVQCRTGITAATAEHPTYPTAGCQLPFRIYDLEFDDSVTGSCPTTDKRAWTSEELGRTINGQYIPIDTEIVYVEVPTPDGKRFWIIPDLMVGTVLFKLLEDRSREKDAAGKAFGRADAIVEAIIGDVPVEVGDTIEVIFGDKRWLGAVKDCEGIADYYNDDGDKWIVKECQELEASYWFVTSASRSPDYVDEDILVAISKHIGHANADFPADQWTPAGDNDPLKVRFYGSTFPYAFAGAVGFATLDVDIANETDNSTMRYYVVQCDQGSILNEVEHEEFCPGGSPAVSQHSPAGWYPFGQRWPSIQSVHDRMDLVSKNGGIGWTTYSHALRKHVILNTEHEEYEFMVPVDGYCPVPMKQKIQALTCMPAEQGNAPATANVISSVELAYEETDAGGSGSGQECSDPKLKLKYRTRSVLACGDESELQDTTINLAQLLVTTDVYDDGDCIIQEQTHVIVFGSCDVIAENVVCTTDEQCDESGSGS